MTKNEALFYRQSIERNLLLSIDYLSDAEIVSMCNFLPVWTPKEHALGSVVRYCGEPYKCIQAHDSTGNSSWTPDVTYSLWSKINVTNSGSASDPIPYAGNMALENGKYYTQNDVMYLCTRDTINAVYNDLAELITSYVEVT